MQSSPRSAPAHGGLFDDHAQHFALPNPAAGKHSATATVRVLATGAWVARTVTFEADAR